MKNRRKLSAAALLIAALLVLSACGAETAPEATPVPTEAPTAAPTETPAPTEAPTPTPSPTPQVSSITITFLGSPRTEFAAKVGDSVPLKATVYPVDSEAEVTWSSEDESIVKVDQDGNVTAVGKGNTKIVVACGGVTAECKVYITG